MFGGMGPQHPLMQEPHMVDVPGLHLAIRGFCLLVEGRGVRRLLVVVGEAEVVQQG